jgi:hypothetical protein
MPAGEEIELVPHVSVARADGHFYAKRGGRDDADAKARRPLSAARRGGRLASRGAGRAGW